MRKVKSWFNENPLVSALLTLFVAGIVAITTQTIAASNYNSRQDEINKKTECEIKDLKQDVKSNYVTNSVLMEYKNYLDLNFQIINNKLDTKK